MGRNPDALNALTKTIQMKPKKTYEIKVVDPNKILQSLSGKGKVVKVSNPDDMKVRGKVVVGDSDNDWMASKYW